MNRTLIVVGTGVFSMTVLEEIRGSFDVHHVESLDALTAAVTERQPAAVLSLADGRDAQAEVKIQQAAHARKLPVLRAHLYADRSFIGPWAMPEEAGCVHCVEMRMHTVHPQKRNWQPMLEAQRSERYRQAEKIWSVPFLEWTADLLKEEMERFASGLSLRLHHQMYVGYDISLKGQLHKFLPHPLCPECSPLPEDAPELAEVQLVPRLKKSPRSYRLPNPLLTRENLRNTFYDWRTGLVHHLFRDLHSKFLPITGAELPLFGEDMTEIGFGRTVTFHDSEMTAMLESLERYAGMHPRGRKTSVYGSYNQWKEQAVNPRDIGIHEEEQYGEPGYAYERYHDDLEFDWVWTYSWRHKKPVLMPEQLYFYRLIHREGERAKTRFVYETSNGCAMGGSLEEAIYYALMEVIERDAFLVSWYNQLPLVELDLEDVEDRNILMVKDRVEAMGYRLHLFDMTMDSGIPSVWATVINTYQGDDVKVKTYTAAGAHSDPEKAIMGALVEVVTSVPIYEETMPALRDRATEMVKDGSKVQTMHDHVLLYSHPETESRFDFLFTDQHQKKGVREVYANWYEQTPPDDLTVELEALMNRLLENGADILILDQTTPELEAVGIKAVKVVVQGMLTMSFGHQYRRIVMDRVQQAPVRMGYRTEPIRKDQLKMDPHPFP